MLHFCNDHCIDELNGNRRPYHVSHIHVFLYLFVPDCFLKVSSWTHNLIVSLNCIPGYLRGWHIGLELCWRKHFILPCWPRCVKTNADGAAKRAFPSSHIYSQCEVILSSTLLSLIVHYGWFWCTALFFGHLYIIAGPEGQRQCWTCVSDASKDVWPSFIYARRTSRGYTPQHVLSSQISKNLFNVLFYRNLRQRSSKAPRFLSFKIINTSGTSSC
jgi:hypothetical protein